VPYTLPGLPSPLQASATLPHPKLGVLVDLVREHFARHKAAQIEQQQGNEVQGGVTQCDVTRAIIFCSYRDQVALVASHLKALEPDIVCR
jgi:ERCC4-related helicase